MHLLENCQPQHEEVAQKLKSSFYVDTCVSGVFNTDEQGRFIEHAKLIMLNGCFNLRGFESNVAGKNVDRSSGDTSVLGVIWNLETDTLKCCTDMDTLTCETKITKRLILAIVQKIFDPIGLLTPATLLPKLLIQHLWKMKIAWDSELSPKDVNVFLKWFRDLYVLKDVTLSRCMIINSTSELHVFVDASKEAYAACVFVRSMFKSDVKVTLVRAKARVAHLKPLSIPRLELMACCIGSRLANSIVNALNLPNLRITFWSDSTTALWWIKEKGSWSVFVENRVKEIRQLARGHLWKHVPGNLNIADLLSRGCSPQQMLISRWWEGPLWLRESPEYWPLGETPGDSEEVELERKKLKVVNIDLSRDAPPWHLYAISDYNKMIRVFSWILRFVNNCTLLNGKCKDSELLQSEIENSEKKLIRLVQSYYLPDAKSSNYVETYIDDEGILRVKTKILNRDDERSFLCFIARRGRPRTIYCDNGTNFRGAFNDLSKLNWSKIVEETRTPKILWKFIPPTAAWWGGWWERLVRTVKELLKRTLGRSVLKYDELYTVLCDCESIINCRPLTYVSENPEELIPLTPSMFLISNKNSNIEDIEELNSNSLNKRIKYRRRDGKIRTVRLKTQHGKMLRPIQRIYPLEIRSNENLQRGMEESIPTVSETLSPDEMADHKILVCIDFDKTLIDCNTDVEIKSLLDGKEVPEEIESLAIVSKGWTAYMKELFIFMHKNNVTKDDYIRCLTQLPLVPGMPELLNQMHKYNGSVDMRLPPLWSQHILPGSHVPSLAAPFPVGDIALSFPFETICWGMLRGLQ
ncbi:integrase catalytic domain-containing protein [Trichonephila clavipes]|nr:integrase catalytic domain-containing protein [Trichonephila clavipes]